MSEDPGERVARMLHHRGQTLAPGDAVVPPITLASIYHLPGEPAGPYQYGRWTNPTWFALEEALGSLEDAEAVAFPSGMAAVVASLVPFLRPGERVLLPSDGYFATRAFTERYLVPMGVVAETRPTATYAQGPFDGLRLVFVETPSNPGLDLCDLTAVVQGAHAAGALVVADNTTMTPLGQRPLDLGADLVVSSDTKALNGHSDVLFGHVAGRDAALMQAVRDWRKWAGAIPGPFEAWLVLRGLETLELRFERMSRSALVLAQRLEGHRALQGVRHPWLGSHPAHNLARAQMATGGSLVGLTFPDAAAADAFLGRCRVLRQGTSFGGVLSSAERRARWGDAVEGGYVRLSVGCEPTEALWRGIEEALEA